MLDLLAFEVGYIRRHRPSLAELFYMTISMADFSRACRVVLCRQMPPCESVGATAIVRRGRSLSSRGAADNIAADSFIYAPAGGACRDEGMR